MTREEARQSLFNTKVYVNGKSKEIQEKLFKLGFKWYLYKKVDHTDKPFLYLNEDENLSHGDDMEFYKNDKYREVSADYILNLKWDKEYPNFYPSIADKIIAEMEKLAKDNYTIKGKLEVVVDLSENRDYSVINVFVPGNRSGTKYYNAIKKAINELDNKPKEILDFNPFDRVLGRDKDGQKWMPDFFQRYVSKNKTNYPYQCMGDSYKQCIPYEGNEDKLK